jgi:lysophospholipase L1-like esterase
LTQITTNFGSYVNGDGGTTTFYDIHKTFISNIAGLGSAVVGPMTLTVPSGAVYVRFQLAYTALSAATANGGASLVSPAPTPMTWANTAAAIQALNAATNPFVGANAYVFGDSITFGLNYTPVLQAKLQLASLSMSGGGGVPMVGSFGTAVAAFNANPTGPSILQLIAAEIAGCSLIVIEMGTNDGGDTLGTIADTATALTATPTTTTFYGDCKMVAAALEAAITINAPTTYPTIIVSAPYLQSRITGTVLENIIAAEQAVFGGLYGYPVINGATSYGINPTNWSVTTIDTIHPNGIGGQMMGATLARFCVANAHQ